MWSEIVDKKTEEQINMLGMKEMLQQVLTFRFVISLNPISLVYRIALCLLCFDVPLFSVVLARLALY